MIRRIALLWLLLGPAFAARGEVLENDVLRIEVSPGNGSITGLRDKRTGAEFMAGSDARLFQLFLPEPRDDDQTRRINSWEQEDVTLVREADRLRIRYGRMRPAQERILFGSGNVHEPEGRIEVDAEVVLSLEGEHVLATLTIENRSLETIHSVVFPYLGTLAAGDPPPRIVLPSLGQAVFTNTFGAFAGERAHRYPAMLATTWINFETGRGSLGLEALSGLEAQDAFFSLSPARLPPDSAYAGSRYPPPFVAWLFHPHVMGQSQWRSPPVRLHVHAGDWRTIAAEHREARRAAEPRRADPWREAIGFATYRLKREDNTINWRYDELPDLAAAARPAGIRHIVVNGWREREGPANPAPFGEQADPRLGGAAALRRAIAKLAEEGVELLFAFHPALLNVFHPTTAESALPAAYPPPQQDWLVRSRRQAAQIPVNYRYYTSDFPIEEYTNRYRVEIDPASPATAFLLGEARRLRDEYGIRNLFLAGVGQRAFLSYNREHGVEPQRAYAVGYERLLGGLRGVFQDGLLLAEGFNDLVNRYSDGGYTWDRQQDMEILSFSLPGRYFSQDVEALDYAAANAAFARKVLINLIVDGGDGTVAGYPEFAAHLAALGKLKASTAPYYADAEFRAEEGVSVAGSDAVIASSFLNRVTEQRGIVVANTGRDAVEVSLSADAAPGARAVLHRVSGTAPLTPANAIPLALDPCEVVIVAIDP